MAALATTTPAAPTAARSSSQRRVPVGVEVSRSTRSSRWREDDGERSNNAPSPFVISANTESWLELRGVLIELICNVRRAWKEPGRWSYLGHRQETAEPTTAVDVI